MRRITLWLVSTVAVLVLLFSYRTSTSGPDRGTAATSVGTGTGAGIVSSPAPAPAASANPGASSGTGGDTGSVVANGSAADTRWGVVQVQVTIVADKITEVTVLRQPDGNREDQEINARALPQLREEVLAAQSADIDGVSGATVTSDGYRESLQAALDAAHFPA